MAALGTPLWHCPVAQAPRADSAGKAYSVTWQSSAHDARGRSGALAEGVPNTSPLRVRRQEHSCPPGCKLEQKKPACPPGGAEPSWHGVMAGLGNQAAQVQRGKEEGLQILPPGPGACLAGRDQVCFVVFEDGAVWSVRTPWRGQGGAQTARSGNHGVWAGAGAAKEGVHRVSGARLMESGDRLGVQVRRAWRSRGDPCTSDLARAVC